MDARLACQSYKRYGQGKGVCIKGKMRSKMHEHLMPLNDMKSNNLFHHYHLFLQVLLCISWIKRSCNVFSYLGDLHHCCFYLDNSCFNYNIKQKMGSSKILHFHAFQHSPNNDGPENLDEMEFVAFVTYRSFPLSLLVLIE